MPHGQKEFISWGDSDLVENLCHLVLAQLPDGPNGTKGLSQFLVPKYLPNAAARVAVSNVSAFISPAAEICSMWQCVSTPPDNTR